MSQSRVKQALVKQDVVRGVESISYYKSQSRVKQALVKHEIKYIIHKKPWLSQSRVKQA